MNNGLFPQGNDTEKFPATLSKNNLALGASVKKTDVAD